MAASDPVLVEDDAPVRAVTLNRPDVRNAVGDERELAFVEGRREP